MGSIGLHDMENIANIGEQVKVTVETSKTSKEWHTVLQTEGICAYDLMVGFQRDLDGMHGYVLLRSRPDKPEFFREIEIDTMFYDLQTLVHYATSDSTLVITALPNKGISFRPIR